VQFTSPGAALASGAVAASQQEAARAGALPAAAAADEAEQRHALQAAAAVAVESAAEVLSGSEGEAGSMPPGERGAELAAEEAEAWEREMREDAGASRGAPGMVVVTRGGDTALPPQSPAKGAGEPAARGGAWAPVRRCVRLPAVRDNCKLPNCKLPNCKFSGDNRF
jgi:hypothetical protein